MKKLQAFGFVLLIACYFEQSALRTPFNCQIPPILQNIISTYLHLPLILQQNNQKKVENAKVSFQS